MRKSSSSRTLSWKADLSFCYAARMILLGGWVVLGFLAFLCWTGAGKLLACRYTGRLIATLAIPSILAGACFWLYSGGPAVADDPWAGVLLVVTLMVAGATMIAVLPVWFIAEERLGGLMP